MAKGRCRNCGSEVKDYPNETTIGYGAVIKRCHSCNAPFIDTRIKELAYKGVQKDDRRVVRSAAFALLGIGILCTALFIGVMYALADGGRIRINFLVIIGPLVLIAGVLAVVMDVCTYKKRQRLLEEELIASTERMKDREYAEVVYDVAFKEKWYK